MLDCPLATIWQLLADPGEIHRFIGNEVPDAITQTRFVVDDCSEQPLPDPALIRLVIRAHRIRDQILHDRSLTLEEIAKSHGFVPSYAARLFRLTLLAPDIIAALLGGRQPPELTARKLMDDTRLPLDWNEQRHALGFAQTS